MAAAWGASMTFDDPTITEGLDAIDEAGLDELDFGAVGLDPEGRVELYNRHEERFSGLTRQQVAGRQFFFDVAPCMNNYMVGERLEETTLDVTMPYVLTFRMRPSPVRLRLIRSAGSVRRWVLVSRG